MPQFYELCRLCAQRKRNKIELFRNDEDGQILLSKISLCLSVQVTKEDMLPKMVCADCQRSVEQFNTFRTKCHKAEERLNKMLAMIVPSKIMATRIKQECMEIEYHESIPLVRSDSPKCLDATPCLNLKPIKNVKCEVDETVEETAVNPFYVSSSPDLIQIISEEIVNHHQFDDIKHPQIEIISENFIEFKERDFCENDENNFYDVKNIAINETRLEPELNYEISNDMIELNMQSKVIDPTAFIEVKMPLMEPEFVQKKTKSKTVPKNQIKKLPFRKAIDKSSEKLSSEPKNRSSSLVKSIPKRKKRRNIVDSDTEINEKFLTLGENEVCDIDMDEMEAIIKQKEDPNARFNCAKCDKSFKFLKCLRKHKEIHNLELETFICDFCSDGKSKNFEFSSLKCLKSHIQRKHLFVDGKFQCEVCNKTLPSQGQLNSHLKKVHDNSGATCQTCGKNFKNRIRLTDHMRVHQDDRPYVCDQCGQSFKWNNGLKVHIQSHKQEKNFLCSECGKKFAAKKNLIEHLNIHTGRRPHVCKHCNASFIQLSAYSKHLYVHNEELKVHRCDKCDKSFSHGYMLKQHMLQHTGLRPYKCSVCLHSFKSQSDLCSHVKIHQEKQYSCSVCGRKFSRSKTLKDHMVRHTGIKHICPAPGCGKSYTQRFPLTKHFCKNHPSLVIINRLGGKKAHLGDKFTNQENFPEHDFIRYDFRYKEDINI